MYFCISCAAGINEGLVCAECVARAARLVVPVRFCNFCGLPRMLGRPGTECGPCETTRLARLMQQRTVKIKNDRKDTALQPMLWQSEERTNGR